MSSFHDQWMSAREEISAIEDERLRDSLRRRLLRAQELISEENDGATRRGGAEIVRDVRLRARRAA